MFEILNTIKTLFNHLYTFWLLPLALLNNKKPRVTRFDERHEAS